MPKLAPVQALPAAESSTQSHAAAAIARATAALARLRANAAARDSVAEYDLLCARAEWYSQRGDTAAAEADLVELARLARELNDLPRQLAAVTRLYEHEHRARLGTSSIRRISMTPATGSSSSRSRLAAG